MADGINDKAESFSEYSKRAPEWLEVRPLELPGLGERSAEPLPLGTRHDASSGGRDATVAHIIAERNALVGSLADAIAPMAVAPYAIFGFSLGALLGYLLVLELQVRQGAWVAICAGGTCTCRGAAGPCVEVVLFRYFPGAFRAVEARGGGVRGGPGGCGGVRLASRSCHRE